MGAGHGVACIGLPLRYRAPVVTAWSTPGAALLVTALAGVPMTEAIGTFMFCAVLILLAGLTRGVERVMGRIPVGIAAAMLAGTLVRFGMEVFVAMGQRFGLVFAMFLAYPAARGLLHFKALRLEFATPVFTAPTFKLQPMLGVGIALFIVTMGSQNVPGTAVLRAAGYSSVPISPMIGWTGAENLLLAPFGCFALNLAAITAAICMGREAHEDPAKP